MKDLEPDIIARFDQAETHLSNMSKLVADYYKDLRESGVPDELAGKLTISMQESLFGAAKK